MGPSHRQRMRMKRRRQRTARRYAAGFLLDRKGNYQHWTEEEISAIEAKVRGWRALVLGDDTRMKEPADEPR